MLGIILFIGFCYLVTLKMFKSPTFTEISSKYRHPSDDKKLSIVSDNTKMSDNKGMVDQTDKPTPIDVMITFTKAKHNYQLQEKFRTTVRSLFHFSTVPIDLHILGDEDSEKLAADIIHDVADKSKYAVSCFILYHSIPSFEPFTK